MARAIKYLVQCLVVLVMGFVVMETENRHHFIFNPAEVDTKISTTEAPKSVANNSGPTEPAPVTLQATGAILQPTVATLQPTVATPQPTVATPQPTVLTLQPTVTRIQQDIKFFLVAPPESTTDLLSGDKRDRAIRYYKEGLNEDAAEIWLHRGFERLTALRVENPDEADAIVVAGYLHMHVGIGGDKNQLPTYYEKHLNRNTDTTKSKPHLFLFPSTNPGTAENIGGGALIQVVKNEWGIPHVWSVSFERNPNWVGVPVERIVPIPYVVKPSDPLQELRGKSNHEKLSDSIFYAGDARKHGVEWGGCNRTAMITPLQQQAIASNTTDRIDVRLVGPEFGARLTQEEYNHRMLISEYCLILCGDTPTSRSLTSAMVAGCIPIRVGSRLRGLCDPPCFPGWGWAVPGENNPHLLPFSETIPWDKFPEVSESELIEKGQPALDEHIFGEYHKEQKTGLHSIMQSTMTGWIYGWGDPVSSQELGDATSYIWHSFSVALKNADY
jgi:Exostosin family